MKRVLLVFVDGLGWGRPGAQNPIDGAPLEVLAPLAGGRPHPRFVYARLDATLGHPGLPQSATGQAVIFTGDDAIAVAGGHREGYPTRALVELLKERSILKRASQAGIKAALLNAYDPARADRLERIGRGEETQTRTFRPSATTWTALAAGHRLRRFGEGITFDVTGDVCRAYGLAAPRLSIQDAARQLLAHDLELGIFEMFLTDKAGHAQDTTWARIELLRVDRLLCALAEEENEDTLVVVTSDHGNVEDLSTGSHTRAEVPLIATGPGADAFLRNAKSLRDLAPRLLQRSW